MIKLAVFDLDGTLLDTIKTISYYCNLTLNHFGYKSLDEKDYVKMVGNGAEKLIERMIVKSGLSLEENFSKMFEFYNKAYNENSTYLTEPFSDICALLKELKSQNIKTYVLSNKPDIATKSVVNEKLTHLIDFALGATDEFPLKPDTTALDYLLQKANVKKDEIVYIGDSDVDVITGKNFGVLTLGVSWGYKDREILINNGADYIIDSPLEILNYIK